MSKYTIVVGRPVTEGKLPQLAHIPCSSWLSLAYRSVRVMWMIRDVYGGDLRMVHDPKTDVYGIYKPCDGVLHLVLLITVRQHTPS